jgi:hypothetical protein
MGVLHGRDLFSSKWVTAVIFDSGGNAHFYPIKYVLGDYFVTDINKKIYVFEIVDSRVKTYRQTLVKSFRFFLYDTTHSRPISTENNQDLADMLRKNNLPKMNMTLFNILKALGRQEKENFTSHELKGLIEEVSKNQGQYSEQALNLVNYLSNLNIEQIVTPVKAITEFIEDDLLATKPGFLGDILSVFQRADVENKKITNTPITGKIAWMKWIAVMALIGLVLAVVYMAYDNGWFDPVLNAGKSLEGFKGINFGGPPGSTDAEFAAKYPTPEAAKAALDRGELHESQIPPAMRELVKNVKTPEAIPTP